MKLITVESKKDWKLFHKTLTTIYNNDPNYIYPLERDIEHTLDRKSNKLFANGDAKCMVLLDDHKKPVGRIAAFVDHERNKNKEVAKGGIGFFECIDDEACASTLFDAAEGFLKDKGLHAVNAPVNFGERDRFWGLLVKGFHPPIYQENYHPPYYEKFFLSRGYIPFDQVLTFKVKTDEIPIKDLEGKAETIKSTYPVEVKPFDRKHPEIYAQGFVDVYNASFKKFAHFKPLKKEVILKMIERAKQIIDPHLLCIAYVDGQAAGFVALFPDVNFFLKHAKGKLNWRTIPGFLLKKLFLKDGLAKGIGVGVNPEYQKMGVFAHLIDFMATKRNLKKYPYACMPNVRAHNDIIVNIYEGLNAKIDRVHIAYRKAFYPDIEIKPLKFLDAERMAALS